jgi:subtilisin family serine protease
MRMRSGRLFAATLVCVGLAACSDAPSGTGSVPASAPAVLQAGRAAQVIADRYIVVFRSEVRDAPGLARQLASAHGGTVHHTYQHAIKGFSATLPASAAAALRHNPNVAYVEQDQRVDLAQVGSWGLDRVDQRDLPLNGGYTYTRTGAGVRAYIIDTGIQTSHSQFGGRASVGYDAVGDGMNGQDCNGHGTHVAGTVGGATYGVAKSVSLVSVRVFGCSGPSAWSTIIAGVDWVRFNHVKPAVANMSLSGGASQAVDDAVRSLITAGVTVAIAAGNDYSYDACYVSPARVSQALTVGATTAADLKADFSNIGSCLDLFAPGDDITSAWLNGGTATIDGTSMATPHVAGAAALYLEGAPTASPAAVGSAIVSNATPNRLSAIGAGSPNLLLYTLFGGTTPPGPLAVDLVGPTAIYSPGTYAFQANATGGNGVYSYVWEYMNSPFIYASYQPTGTNSPSYSHTFVTGSYKVAIRVTVTSGGSTASDVILVQKY